MRPLARLCLLMALSCGGGSTPGLELGTGRSDFVHFEPDAPMLVQRGCQGSQHVYVSLRVQHLEEPTAIVELELQRAEDGEVASLPFRARLPFEPAVGGREVVGLMLVVPDPQPFLAPRPLRLIASVTTESSSATAQHTSILRWGADACP